MTITGIISEYNPFHMGHKYHIDITKQTTGSDYVVIVMSGNFCQRGTPAFFDKMTRAKSALLSGADLVIEMPSLFATANAESFAMGGLSILDTIGVDYISFGTEADSIDELLSALDSIENNEAIKSEINKGYKSGKTYASVLSEISGSKALSNPNNILGLEYIKAIKSLDSKIKPVNIKRLGQYNDQNLSVNDNTYSSASAIRHAIISDGITSCQNHIPDNLMPLYKESLYHYGPINQNDFSNELLYALNINKEKGYEDFLGIDRSLSDRIRNNLDKYTNFEDFISIIKPRNLTYSHISRALLHVLLSIKKDQTLKLSAENPMPYIRVLGFREDARPLLKQIKENSISPVIYIGDDARKLEGKAQSLMNGDIFASNLYISKIQQKYGQAIPKDFASPVLKF